MNNTPLSAPPARAPSVQRPLRVRYNSRFRVLLCYTLCWGLAALLVYAALRWLFPYKLVGASPDVLGNLTQAFPFLRGLFARPRAALLVEEQATVEAITRAIALRDLYWRQFVGASVGVVMLMSLFLQLGWRAAFTRVRRASRAVGRAIRWYRLLMALIWLLNIGGALFVYLIGVRFIAEKTIWDYAIYFGGFAITPFAALLCFRLAAPPTLSGYRAFFRRL